MHRVRVGCEKSPLLVILTRFFNHECVSTPENNNIFGTSPWKLKGAFILINAPEPLRHSSLRLDSTRKSISSARGLGALKTCEYVAFLSLTAQELAIGELLSWRLLS